MTSAGPSIQRRIDALSALEVIHGNRQIERKFVRWMVVRQFGESVQLKMQWSLCRLSVLVPGTYRGTCVLSAEHVMEPRM